MNLEEQLMEYNRVLFNGSVEYRYEYGSHGKRVVSKKRPEWFSVKSAGLWGSVRKANNKMLCALDFDGVKNINDVWTAVAEFKDSWKEHTPLYKASGVKGAQIIMEIDFHDLAFTLQQKQTRLEAYARFLYKEHKIKKTGLKIGRPSDMSASDSYIDTSMFDSRRMLRGFCRRIGSDGRKLPAYSVPILPDDTLSEAKKRMKLELPLPKSIEIPLIKWSIAFEKNYLNIKDTDKVEYKHKRQYSGTHNYDYEWGDISKQPLDEKEYYMLDKIPHRIRDIWNNPHPSHNQKFQLICHLDKQYKFMAIQMNERIKKIFNLYYYYMPLKKYRAYGHLRLDTTQYQIWQIVTHEYSKENRKVD